MSQEEWRLIDRLKEPSSYAAIAAGFAGFGVTFPQEWVHAISLAGAGIACLLGIVLKENTK